MQVVEHTLRPASALLLALFLGASGHFGAKAAAPSPKEVLPLSIQFFEAQMSGSLPSWSYAMAAGWRSDSHLNDGKRIGKDTIPLSGGWYTDGGHIKNSLTIGVSASLMALAALTWDTSLHANTDSDDTPFAALLRNVDWAADYLTSCAASPGEFVAQVGDHFTEEAYWGAPEAAAFSLIKYSSGWRPVYTVSTTKQYDGADVVSQAVAALTGAALMHRRLAPLGSTSQAAAHNARAASLLATADGLWAVAQSMTAVWRVPEGNRTIYSRTYTDDQAWAAAWMCMREVAETESTSGTACAAATSLFDSLTLRDGGLNADSMHAAAAVALLSAGVGGPERADSLAALLRARYLDTWIAQVAESQNPGGSRCAKCKDFSFPCAIDYFVIGEGKTGSQYSAAMSFLALAATATPAGEAAFGPDYSAALRCGARQQVGYLLGDNLDGRAFVTGLDAVEGFDAAVSFPRNPRHRAASCNGKDKPCARLGESNPQALLGALVGGPHPDGSYTDSRIAEPDNLVSIDANAMLVGALAGLAASESKLTAC